jgi:hypothetical protein
MTTTSAIGASGKDCQQQPYCQKSAIAQSKPVHPLNSIGSGIYAPKRPPKNPANTPAPARPKPSR